MPRPSRKQDLLDAGVTAVLDQGATQTSVEGVCRDVGVTKGSFFHHFKDKDDFVCGMLTTFGERGMQALARFEAAPEASAASHLHDYLQALGTLYAADPWFRRGCLYLIVAQEFESHARIRGQCEQGLERWIQNSTAEFERIRARSGQAPLVPERQLAEQLLYTLEGALHVGRTMGQRDSVIRALQQFERYAAAALHIG